MFMVSFDPEEDMKKIYNITKLLNTIVKIEPIKASKLIPQCKNCQAYGHTKNYCSKSPRCVKCAGKHPTHECSKTEIEQPKCCNCGEPHPASYRGCLVAKELQKMRNNVRIQKNSSVNMRHSNRLSDAMNAKNPAPAAVKQIPLHGRTYAQVTKTNKPSKDLKHDDILTIILQKLTAQESTIKSLQLRLDETEQSSSKSAKNFATIKSKWLNH